LRLTENAEPSQCDK